MDDLISKQTAVDVIHQEIYKFFDICEDDEESPMTYKDEMLLELNKAISKRLKDLPVADAIPVIRCKDCKWYRKSGKYCGLIYLKPRVKPDFYCGSAERRTDECSRQVAIDAVNERKLAQPKPCPYCGGNAIRKQCHFKVGKGESRYKNEHHEDGSLKWTWLECDSCGRATEAYCYEYQATDYWNKGKAERKTDGHLSKQTGGD